MIVVALHVLVIGGIFVFEGCSRTIASTSSTLSSPATAALRIAPCARRCKTSERVSTPLRATIPRSCSQSIQRGPRASRMTTAVACTRPDCDRSLATP